MSRQGAAPAKPKVDGPQSAIVAGPASEEIFCDRYGRVRVRFHWDHHSPDNEESSCWIRVSQAWASAGFSNLAMPWVSQEVIVASLHGDPDQPLIAGGMSVDDITDNRILPAVLKILFPKHARPFTMICFR